MKARRFVALLLCLGATEIVLFGGLILFALLYHRAAQGLQLPRWAAVFIILGMLSTLGGPLGFVLAAIWLCRRVMRGESLASPDVREDGEFQRWVLTMSISFCLCVMFVWVCVIIGLIC